MSTSVTSLPRFRSTLLILALSALPLASHLAVARDADRVIDLWPEFAPGESTRNTGEALPKRASENPPATRIRNITRPQLHVFEPDEVKRKGTSVLVFPGGGYSYVVVDKEGSEAAEWLNSIGVTAFVVYYRTKPPTSGGIEAQQQNPDLQPFSERPLQDAQRAVSLVRHNADQWKLNPGSIGVAGFSAGGLTAALATTRFDDRAYERVDRVDESACRPDFAMLLYPWRLIDDRTGKLNRVLSVSKQTPPVFFVHAHNDGITSLNSVLFYSELRRVGVPAELHIYQTGGHGFGLRAVEGSDVSTWRTRAEEWLRVRSIIAR